MSKCSVFYGFCKLSICRFQKRKKWNALQKFIATCFSESDIKKEKEKTVKGAAW